MLTVVGVSKRYGPIVGLDEVSVSAPPGRALVLLGPNGAGKTTLLSIIAGLRRADGGTVTIDGVEITSHPERAIGKVGIAAQDPAVYPVLTVRENLRYMARLSGLGRVPSQAAAVEVAEALRLEGLLDRRAKTLSGGERRRLHVGMAMVGRPSVLLLDEPTAGVDVETRPLLVDLVRQIAADGTTVIYSTHYIPEIDVLDGADVVILHHGRVTAAGTIEDLIREHGQTAIDVRWVGPPPDLTDTNAYPCRTSGRCATAPLATRW